MNPHRSHRYRRRIWPAVVVALAVAVAGLTGIEPATADPVGRYHCGVYVLGAIGDKYLQLGGERGGLGCPVGQAEPAGDGGRKQRFREGYVYSHPDRSIGTHAVWGEIGRHWARHGLEGRFGYPVTDEMPTPDGRGRFTHFQRGASIYWTPSTGAQLIYGAIREKWASLGWERGPLGYPTSDEVDGTSSRERLNRFQHGELRWLPDDPLISTLVLVRKPRKELDVSWTARRGWDGYNVRWGDAERTEPVTTQHCAWGSPGWGMGDVYIPRWYCSTNTTYPNGKDEHQFEVDRGRAHVGDGKGNTDYLGPRTFVRLQGCTEHFLRSSDCQPWRTYVIAT
jgi:uncharacterized protein with LGFP repeats